ncbi:MAG: nitroreductase [Clostridia bacterium]|nr:nitroreductase [Clostridia bacterium]
MNNELLYNMIFKRKSFHLFRDKCGSITNDELDSIKSFLDSVIPLDSTIKIDIKIVKESDTTCSRGGEYCILFYSEVKDNYLQNIGYIGEQIDLYLASLDIGALWFGIGKPKVSIENGLEYVIMISIAKVPSDKFRRDMFKAKRKLLDEIYSGTNMEDIFNITRFAPSACNTQPWYVKEENNSYYVYRFKKPGKRGIMPDSKVTYYNRIDIGIFILIMEVCLQKNNKVFDRKIHLDDGNITKELSLNAIYTLKN